MKTGKSAGALLALYTTRPDYIAAVYKKDLYGERRKDKEFMKYMNPEHPEVVNSLPAYD